jgi:hypothetical protein
MPDKLPPEHGVGAHKDKMGKVMHEFKRGQLHSGTGKKGKKGPVVKSRQQAIAIGISESKHVEQLVAMGYSEEAAFAVASFIESQKAADEVEQHSLEADIDSKPGKQKGAQGKSKQDPQGSIAQFPTVPHSEGAQSTACPQPKSDAEKQAEKAQKGTQPTQPQTPDVGQQQPTPKVQSVEQAAEAERKKQQREECKKMRGN